ncbi:multicopper oxidase domain-containing protein [Aurantimonas coralicida]|uniref:multicopper oxidase domain-containing protein n=1 Tax=Aurantimonas coralicida TaxID=182270 RepID=UPI001D1910A4|nr:multicopper oxidase domain-containing protein [Aurantimonas coralicida]MCC4300280.1 multicopper oxidase domain-containing protein [Aurantimonas coralicida]
MTHVAATTVRTRVAARLRDGNFRYRGGPRTVTCPISRRSLLLESSAMLATTAISRASAATRRRLVAAAGQTQIVLETFAGPAPVWAFNGTAPGPVLRVRAGERRAIDVENGLDQPTSVHWHGIRIDNAMDGGPGLTQAAIAPGEQFPYDFVAPDPGTYWYPPAIHPGSRMPAGFMGRADRRRA